MNKNRENLPLNRTASRQQYAFIKQSRPFLTGADIISPIFAEKIVENLKGTRADQGLQPGLLAGVISVCSELLRRYLYIRI